MDRAALLQMLEKEYPARDDAREAAVLADMLAAKLPGQEQKRPSVESILHALFPYRYVLHLHPALVNGLTCSINGEAACGALLGGEAVWIPLAKLGYGLAVSCRKILEEQRSKTGECPHVLLLQNHGIFVSADTVEEIDAAFGRVMKALSGSLRQTPDLSEIPFNRELACSIAPALRMLYNQEGRAAAVFCTNSMVREFVADRKSFEALMEPLMPDQIAYCKDAPLFVEPEEDLSKAVDGYAARKGYKPRIVAVRGLGFFALGGSKQEAETARLLFLNAMKVTVYTGSFGGALALPREYIGFILYQNPEKPQKKAALSGGDGGRLAGKIVIVTGSAQGFGKGIAEEMAAQGAYIIAADLNLEGAKAFRRELEERHGSGAAEAVRADVSDEESVKAMVEEAVLCYGGLDVLVSNAGIAIAGSLEEMSKERFQLVTSVNYTGYFLCAKYACVPMKLQRRYSPGYTADIIEINSKSGLSGSNKNFAYAGSKFGGIGLTQSFALELVEYGIKVNAVCPGNLLDGPLWSDPEKGLFKQYLDAGKVPGAKTIADVRAFYEAKVPMNRGCTVKDVACAVRYLIEQQYETGQALPVTGGQVMLK